TSSRKSARSPRRNPQGMRLLAIDTSLEACSVGVSADDVRPPVTVSEVIGRGHAERLMGMIETAMAEAGLTTRELERIAVTLGPPEVAAAELIAERLDEQTLLAGAGADQVLAGLGRFDEARIVHRDAAPDVAALLRLGRHAPPPSSPPRPLYLRPPDAKPQAAFAVARQEEARRAAGPTGTEEEARRAGGPTGTKGEARRVGGPTGTGEWAVF